MNRGLCARWAAYMIGRLRELDPELRVVGTVDVEGGVRVHASKDVANQRINNRFLLSGESLSQMYDPKSACDFTVAKLLNSLRDAESRVLADRERGLE